MLRAAACSDYDDGSPSGEVQTMRTLSLALAVLFVAACSDDTSTPDSGPVTDGPVAADTSTLEGGGQTDTGTDDTGSDDTGSDDTGGTDDSSPGDTGSTDTSGQSDTTQQTCDPNFGQQQACGGNLSGTKWNYTEGCVADAAFDPLKQNCPGATVSNVAYAMTANSTLQFFANGSMIRVFNGQITGQANFPQACTGLGCPALQSALQLALINRPGSTVACTAATGGGCDCDVMINLFAWGGGQYTINGNVVTVTPAGGTAYPYYYCVSGNTLTYAGTPQNPSDTNVTYVLSPAP
jgi:hypothetical protein